MSRRLESSIVRILSTNGNVTGSGFLLFDRYVLTCAHVVLGTLGVKSDSLDIPNDRIHLDFPLVNPQEILTAKTVWWKPIRPKRSEREDIAILELEDELPFGSSPVRLLNVDDLWDHPFMAFGFPTHQINGVWAFGKLRGRQASNWVQIENVNESGYRVQPGFSGAPVWDDQVKGVVGMVVASEKQRDTRAAFIIPSSILIEFWNEFASSMQIPVILLSNISTLRDPLENRKEDWDGSMNVEKFFGRENELAELEKWIVTDRCRLIEMLGIGGIGKTALSLKLAENIKTHFSYVIWRTLRNGPPLEDILDDLIKVLSDQSKIDVPEKIDDKIFLLIEYLKKYRCLLLIDNVESILKPGDRAGNYREGYEGYGRLFQYIAETAHQSCLVFTTREKPKELSSLEGKNSPVRSMHLHGLGKVESREILSDKDLSGSEKAWTELIDRYSGNPLALKLVSEPIQELFGGDIDSFLEEGAGLFDDIFALLKQQFSRLSSLEKVIMYWLAIDRDVVSLDDLLKDIVRLAGLEKDILYWLSIEQEEVSLENILQDIIRPVSKRELLEELASLRRRSMIETVQLNFTLQPVIMEYMTDDFIDQICEEIVSGKIMLFASHALIKAQAKDYIRNSQIRMILKPIVEELLNTYKGKRAFEQRLMQIITRLRKKSPLARGYVGGNVLNLLCELKSNLTGFDFSDVTVNQAYLQGVELHEVNFTNCDLTNSIFTETFGSILSVAFSPDGNSLVAGSIAGEVRLWQITDSKRLINLSQASLLWSASNKSDDWVWCVAFSPNGKTLVSGNDNSFIRLWDAITGECLKKFEGHADRIWSVAYSPDSSMLVSGSDDKTLRLWDVNSGQLLNTFLGHSDRVVSVAFSSDGKTLASASEDRTLKIWDASTGQCLNTLWGHTNVARAVTFNPDGKTLASAGEDRTLKIWDASTGQCLNTLWGHTNAVRTIAYSPDGNMLVSGSDDKTLRLWDVNSGQLLNTLQGHTSQLWSVAFSPDGNTIASGSEDQTLKIWDVSTGQCLKTLQGYSNQVWSVAFHPEGTTIASGNEDRTVKLWNVETGHTMKSLSGHINRVRSVTFSSDGSTLASGSEDFSVKLWNVKTAQLLNTFRGHTNFIWSVAYSPDGSMLASGSDDQTIKLWDIKTGRCCKTLQVNNSSVWSVAFSPDGTMLVSCHEDQALRLWDVSTGQCFNTLMGHTDVVRSAAFSPDGSVIISGSHDQTVKVWDVSTGQCLKTLKGHTSRIKTVAFSSDGDTIASGCDDQTVKVWSIKTGECLHTLQGHTDSVKSVRFSLDGDLVVSGGEDEAIKVWNVKTGNILRALKNRKPYEGMNITGVTGITEAEKATLKTLGAIENDVFMM